MKRRGTSFSQNVDVLVRDYSAAEADIISLFRVGAHLNFLISYSTAGSPVSNKLQHFYVNECPFCCLIITD